MAAKEVAVAAVSWSQECAPGAITSKVLAAGEDVSHSFEVSVAVGVDDEEEIEWSSACPFTGGGPERKAMEADIFRRKESFEREKCTSVCNVILTGTKSGVYSKHCANN